MLISNSAILRVYHVLYKLKNSKRVSLNNKFGAYDTYYKELHTVPQNGPWDVLFFGTDEFSTESLKVLHNKYESKVLQRLEVVTADRVKQSAVTKYAKKHGLVINKWPPEIDMSKFHIGIVVSFGHMIPSKIIDAFPLGLLNVHASLLPRWRGAAPIIYTLMHGDQQTGVTIMKIMPKKFDTGAVVSQKQIDISEHETLPELHTKLSKLGANLLAEVFDSLPQILDYSVPQTEENVTYAPKVTSQISYIKWDEMSGKNVYDLYRALLGLYIPTATFEGTKIKLLDIEKVEQPVTKLEGKKPGNAIYDKSSNALIIRCKAESYISVKKVVLKGRPVMNARDFYNGFIAGKKKDNFIFLSCYL